MCPGEDRRGGTAAMSSVECGQCGHATGDHWHWRLYTDSPGSQAGCGGGDRFNSGWAELSGLKVIGAIKMCTLKTAASRSNTAPTRTPELLPLLQERRKLHLHIYFFRGGVDPREVFTRKCLELRNARHSGNTTTAAQPQFIYTQCL